MNQRIIYQTDEGGVAIIIPSPQSGLTIQEIALKDVPANVAYKIVDISEIPTDRTFRNAWESDFDEPDGYGIGPDAFRELKNQQSESNNDQN
jgi:hypothetical protein